MFFKIFFNNFNAIILKIKNILFGYIFNFKHFNKNMHEREG